MERLELTQEERIRIKNLLQLLRKNRLAKKIAEERYVRSKDSLKDYIESINLINKDSDLCNKIHKEIAIG